MTDDRSILRAQLLAVSPNGVVIHAAALAIGAKSILLLAPSGGGKTTAALNLAEHGWRLIGDDSVVVAEGTDGVIRTLPCGSHRIKTGHYSIPPAELRGLAFIEKGAPLQHSVRPGYGFYRAMRIGSLMARDIVPQSVLDDASIFLQRLFLTFPSTVFRIGARDSGEKVWKWFRNL